MSEDYKYWAFISYSHADEAWATWLHKALETYRVPKRLVGRETPFGALPKRVFPVFRDRDELAGAADLGEKLHAAIRQSRYLIAICSPHSAVSKWVNEEIKTFKALGRENRVLSLIVDGEPNATDMPERGLLECFPPAMRFQVGANGELSSERSEPIAADARKGKDGRDAAKLKLLAGVLGVGYDDLRQREQRRQRMQRIQLAVGAVAVAGASALAYTMAADAGAHVPGYLAIQELVDSQQISVFRKIHTDAEIQQTAAKLRLDLAKRLENDARKTIATIVKSARKPGDTSNDDEFSVWGASQLVYVLLHVPELTPQQLRQYISPILNETFREGRVIPRYGWREYRAEHTRAEPAMWTAAALALLAARGEVLGDSERPRVLKRFEAAQAILATFRQYGDAQPAEPGAWYMVPHQTEQGEYFTYSALLALYGLLEARSAKLPWDGSAEKRDELLAATARWLIRQFDAKNTPPGWRPAPDDRGAVSDGLTLQIYGTLLQLEDEIGLKIPPHIEAAIGEHVRSLGNRRIDHPTTNNRFIRTFHNHQGRAMSVTPTTEYLWYPWAIECTVRWLARLQKQGKPVVDQVRVRRVLGHLVVKMNEGEGIVRATIGKPDAYIAAETLYGLSVISAPGAKQIKR